MKRVFVSILLIALLFGAIEANALDDKVLVLPPSYNDVDYNPEIWLQIIQLYDTSILGKSPISMREVNEKWQGEIRVVDFQNLDDAFGYGQEFDADYVLMTSLSEERKTMDMQLVDPWQGTIEGSALDVSTPQGIFKIEQGSWVYGLGVYWDEPEFSEPQFLGGDKAVHNYLHTNNTYPPEAAIGLVKAQLEIEVIVSESGVPVQVKVLSNSQPYYPFDIAVEQALWAIKYIPAKTKKGAVNALMQKRITVYPNPD